MPIASAAAAGSRTLRAATRLSPVVGHLHPACAVSEHTLLEATRFETADIYSYAIGHGLASGNVYVASIWVWLSAGFRGELVGAVFNGYCPGEALAQGSKD